ncbi:uncharacterized protein B0J16DRAFT_277076, partial [Fusarium flagelliforme]|uniref:uncharacterized protein n=2 Tax=Fusarium flagelliforme TaxID=2675880 RepID=UPI001E8E73B0
QSLSLYVHPEARLLICFNDNCKHAISPNGAHPTNHLREKHNILLSERKGLSKVLATLDLKNPDQAAPLADGTPEDRKLRSHDGFSCLHCKYRTINFTLIMQHYGQDLPNYPQHPRRSTRKADIETYFEYARECQRNRRLVPGPDNAGDAQTAAADSATTYAEQRPWLERTRWETAYKNRDRSLLRRLVQTPYLQLHGRSDAPPYLLASAARVPGLSVDLVSPREDEIRIDWILKIVDVVMDRCEETVHGTSRSLLCWLKSNHPHMLCSKPFTLVEHASSTTRYRLLWKKALAFCFRAYRMDTKQRERPVDYGKEGR